MAPIIEADRPGRVAAIVVNYRTPALALSCLRAILNQRDGLPGLRVLLVDGGSSDGSAEQLALAVAALDDPGVGFLPLPINGGFGYANNQALMRLARDPVPPDYVCLVNPDAKPTMGALGRLAALLDREPAAAAVGAQLQEENGMPQGSAFIFPSIIGEFCRGAGTDVLRRLLRHPQPVVTGATPRQAPWVTGAAVMFRMDALAQVGLFDDGFFLYFEEVELMHRLRQAGWEIWHDPLARVQHAGGGSTDIKWGADGFHKRAALPRYWYASRRRYLVRTGGRRSALLAGLAFLAGRAIWQARVVLQRRADGFPLRTSRDTARFSWWPACEDSRAHVPRLEDMPGALPAWMAPRR